MTRTRTALALTAVLALPLLAACQSDADKVSKNISTQAEQFGVQRRIVGVNGVTDKVEFLVEGRCSIETPAGRLEVTCKQGPNDYRKHVIGLSDNVFFISTQLEGIDASVYRTKIVLKPENIVPDFDLVTGQH